MISTEQKNTPIPGSLQDSKAQILISNLPLKYKTQKLKQKLKSFFKRNEPFKLYALGFDNFEVQSHFDELFAILIIPREYCRYVKYWKCCLSGRQLIFEIFQKDFKEQVFKNRMFLLETFNSKKYLNKIFLDSVDLSEPQLIFFLRKKRRQKQRSDKKIAIVIFKDPSEDQNGNCTLNKKLNDSGLKAHKLIYRNKSIQYKRNLDPETKNIRRSDEGVSPGTIHPSLANNSPRLEQNGSGRQLEKTRRQIFTHQLPSESIIAARNDSMRLSLNAAEEVKEQEVQEEDLRDSIFENLGKKILECVLKKKYEVESNHGLTNLRLNHRIVKRKIPHNFGRRCWKYIINYSK